MTSAARKRFRLVVLVGCITLSIPVPTGRLLYLVGGWFVGKGIEMSIDRREPLGCLGFSGSAFHDLEFFCSQRAVEPHWCIQRAKVQARTGWGHARFQI